MAARNVESKIYELVEHSVPFCADMIARWIIVSMTGNDYMIVEIADGEFLFTDIHTMDFTANVKVAIGPEFIEDQILPFTWKKRGTSLNAAFE